MTSNISQTSVIIFNLTLLQMQIILDILFVNCEPLICGHKACTVSSLVLRIAVSLGHGVH